MGPQQVLDQAEIENKWKLTPFRVFKMPQLTERMWRTALTVSITLLIYKFLLGDRNPCFALIGAVYGVGSQFEEGFHNGVNRFIGTFVGGLMVIPFYGLCNSQPFGVPDFVWLILGLCMVLWLNLTLGADSAIQPGTVVYFVVMFTIGKENVVSYTVSRILDTGGGVFVSLALTVLLPSEHDKKKGLTILTTGKAVIHSFKSYMHKNRAFRENEIKNFGSKKIGKKKSKGQTLDEK